MRRLITQLAVVFALPLTAAAQTGPARAGAAAKPVLDDLLRLVPDAAALVVVVPNFADAAVGVQAFGAASGIKEFAETDPDTLFDDLDVGDLPDEWRQRVRKSGPFVLALTEPDADPLLICTVTEPGPAPTDELIELKGNVLIVAPDADVMKAVRSASGKFAKRFEKQGRPALKGHDFALFLDVSYWAEQIDQMFALAEMFAQMSAPMGAGAPSTQAAQANLMMFTWLFKTLRTALDESETIVIAARINGDGMHFSKLVHFKRAGRIAEYLGKVRKSDQDLLRGLPAERGAIILASEWKLPPDVATFSEKMLEVVIAAGPEQPDDELKRATQKAMELYRAILGYNGVMTFAAQPPVMTLSGFYFSDNPQRVFDGMPALWEVSGPMMKAMTPGFSMEVSDEMETIGSVKARVYHFKFDADDEQMQRLLKAIYGESTTFYAAPHPEGVAYTMGSAEVARQRLERLLSAKAARLTDDAQVTNALRGLSPKPQAFVLLDLPGLMKWGMEFATAGLAGAPAPEAPQLELPKTPTPYVAFGLYLHETSCGAELFLPAKTLKVLVESFQRATSSAPGSEPY